MIRQSGGSRWERERRKSLIGNSPLLKNTNFKISITWETVSGSWLYCTSIDPKVNGQRIIQMKRTDPEYNFMTKIDEPTTFAQQLGYDFGRQIEINRDLECDERGWHLLASAAAKISEIGGYSIFVRHGPVIYLEAERSAEFISHASKKKSNRVTVLIEDKKGEVQEDLEIGNQVALFVKDKRYEVQQEYRFVVSVNFHSPKEKAIFLKVSEDLKRFMSPLSFR